MARYRADILTAAVEQAPVYSGSTRIAADTKSQERDTQTHTVNTKKKAAGGHAAVE